MSTPAGQTPRVVRLLLFGLLGLMIVIWVLDRGARKDSQDFFDILADMDVATDDNPMRADMHARLNRDPDEAKRALGGLIDEYVFTSGLPGKNYRVLVAYADDGEGRMQYVDHFLNEIENENHLANQISKNAGAAIVPGDSSAALVAMAAIGRAQRFTEQDRNGDGNLTGDEIPDEWLTRLDQFDTNRDGTISLAEYQARFQRPRRRGPIARAVEGAPEGRDNINMETGRPYNEESPVSKNAKNKQSDGQPPAPKRGDS